MCCYEGSILAMELSWHTVIKQDPKEELPFAQLGNSDLLKIG
jgi:hypothetical protein